MDRTARLFAKALGQQLLNSPDVNGDGGLSIKEMYRLQQMRANSAQLALPVQVARLTSPIVMCGLLGSIH